MRILALDPGKQNFAFAVGEDGRLERFGFVGSLLTDLTTDLTTQAADLGNEFRKLIEETRPDMIVAERFMARGLPGQGANSEFINISLGILLAAALPIPVRIIPSATWKNHWSRLTRPVVPAPAPEKKKGKKGEKTPKVKQPKVKQPKFEMLDVLDPTKSCRPGGRRARLSTHESDAIGIMLWAFHPDHPDCLRDVIISGVT